MPLYEYKCHSCGKTFEVIQKFSDSPLKTHEECGGEVERLLSAPAFHLKGTGWYATDYAKQTGAPSKAGEGKSDATKAASESKPDSGGDSKPSDTKTVTDTKPAESKPSAATTSETK
ncbi:MAG: zinc ribbon domain-containing protein [Terriglobia bacterium]